MPKFYKIMRRMINQVFADFSSLVLITHVVSICLIQNFIEILNKIKFKSGP